MNDNLLVNYYIELQKMFHHYFEKTLQDQNIENIHQLRVSIKKLKALWSIMQFINPDKWNKKSHKQLLSTIFKPAGRLREVQINYSLIQKNEIQYLKPYKIYLINSQESFKRELLESMRTFDLDQLDGLDKNLLQHFGDLSDETILNSSMMYMKKEIKKVHGFWKRLPDNFILHEIRISLKIIVEVLNIIRIMKPRSGFAKFQNSIKSLNSKIGIWHDQVVLTDSFKNFMIENSSKKSIFFNNYINRRTKKENANQTNIQILLPKYVYKYFEV